MAETTKIQWTDCTFNPWSGCEKKKMPDGTVHPGCVNCYAEVDRSVKMHGVKWGSEKIGGTRVKTSQSYWNEPLKWNRQAEKEGRRRKVFCESLGDVFEDWQGPILDHKGSRLLIDYGAGRTGEIRAEGETSKSRKDWCDLTMDDVRQKLIELTTQTPWLIWQFLTKRPENVLRMCDGQYHENWWIGTSVSDQETADKMIQHLLKCRDLCPVLFVSAEPLVGEVDLFDYMPNEYCSPSDPPPCLDWVIVGGESGPKARPCNIDWIRSIVRQCADAGVACFNKQLGSNAVYLDDGGITGNELLAPYQTSDKKGGDPDEWPDDLKVFEFPEVAALANG